MPNANSPRIAGPAVGVNPSSDLAGLRLVQSFPWVAWRRLPAGWRTARTADGTLEAVHIAVAGSRASGGWDGCSTTSSFVFTGVPTAESLRQIVSLTLASNQVEDIDIVDLKVPQGDGAVAVRGTGHVVAPERYIWTQFTLYAKGSARTDRGELVQHCLHLDDASRISLKDNAIQISDALHDRFLMSLNNP